MMEKSNIENQVPEFIKIIAGYTDDELRKVLKKKKTISERGCRICHSGGNQARNHLF
jgi:hypothetical protein